MCGIKRVYSTNPQYTMGTNFAPLYLSIVHSPIRDRVYTTLTKDKTNYKSGSLGYSQAFTFWYIDDVFSVINY